MAATTTTTNTLDVICVDGYANEYTFKLDNYRTDVTLADVTTAFNAGINSGYWYSKAGYPFVSVKRASKVTTVKTTEGLS